MNRTCPEAEKLAATAATFLELSHDKRAEVMSKDAVEGAVEHEVGRRIDEEQEVSDLADSANQVTALVVVTEPEDSRHNSIRSDADDEDNDDSDEHQRDAAVAW